jgi:NADH dehydrogenase
MQSKINSMAKLPPQAITRSFAAIANVLDILNRIGWPIVDIFFRVWVAKQLLVAAVITVNRWNISVLLATHGYPIPWLSPHWAVLLAIAAQFIGGFSLLFGLLTRVGVVVILMFSLITQIYYIPSDSNLFWIILMLGYFLQGPGPISLDHLLGPGVNRSAIPSVFGVVAFCHKHKQKLLSIFQLILRCWIMMSILFVVQKVIHVHPSTLQTMASWLPLHSALLLFGDVPFLFPLLLGLGFATRLTALIGLGVIAFHGAGQAYSIYWIIVMAILVVSGPGVFSLDQWILHFFKRCYPQFSHDPSVNLSNLPHVVIIGAGFGGIACAKALRYAPVRITLIDRHNYHLFQPLLYQTATGNLSPADIAISIRSIFLKQSNVDVILRTVTAINKDKQYITADGVKIAYDYLVVATGSTPSYFGKNDWMVNAPGLKTIEDAVTIRSRILKAFELAELADSKEECQKFLNFIIVGGGPTGVELAGAIAELSRYGMEKNFRHFDPSSANIILIQAAPRILSTFSKKISSIAEQSLKAMGIKILTNSMVEKIDEEGVIVNGERIYSKSVVWAAGVTASPAVKWLKVEPESGGRVKVDENLSLPNYPTIFVIGDTAYSKAWNGQEVPGLAPAAKQGGIYVAKVIAKAIYQKPMRKPFKYSHMGSLATIGRKSAVVEFDHFRMKGALAWWFWGGVHIAFLVGARNRLSVILNWLWAYFTFRANNLLIMNDDK